MAKEMTRTHLVNTLHPFGSRINTAEGIYETGTNEKLRTVIESWRPTEPLKLEDDDPFVVQKNC